MANLNGNGAALAPIASPLGRYADLVTAIVSVILIVSAIAAHLGIIGAPDPFLDSVALVAVGVLYGTARGVASGQAQLSDRANLNTQLALAAHERLDQVNAPPAPLDHSGVSIGKGS